MADLFPAAFGIEYRGQLYRPESIEPHVRKDGTESTLICWSTNCADCGHRCIVKTGVTFRMPSRRCSECKAPGVRVP